MTVSCKQLNGKWRLINSNGDIEKTKGGRDRDGGGHESKDSCQQQMRAINANVNNSLADSNSVHIKGGIGWDVFSDTVSDQLDKATGDVTLHVNSRGGDFFEALGIFNAVKQYDKGKITAQIEGSALSSASFITMAAGKVSMSDASLWMMHEPQVVISGSLSQVQQRLESAVKSKEIITKAYGGKSGKGEQKIGEMLNSGETWMGAEEAKESGFVDEVVKVTEGDTVTLDISNSFKQTVPEKYQKLLENDTMSELLDLANSLDIEVGEGVDPKDAIKKAFTLPAKKETTLPKAVIEMLIKARDQQLDGLVRDGKLTKAAKDEFAKNFCNIDTVSLCVQADGSIGDGFDVTMDALEKQEPVVQLGEVTAAQRYSLKDEDNPTIQNAKKRAAMANGN